MKFIHRAVSLLLVAACAVGVMGGCSPGGESDKLVINESPVVTNFYLEKGPKYGIGTEQSHIRYEKVMAHLAERSEMSADELRDELAGVAKSNFPDDFHTTEWSIVYDQKSLTATYYRREDYDHPWMVFI